MGDGGALQLQQSAQCRLAHACRGCLAAQAGVMRHEACSKSASSPAVKPWQGGCWLSSQPPAVLASPRRAGLLAARCQQECGTKGRQHAHPIDPCHGHHRRKVVAVTLVLMQVRHACSESKGKSMLTLSRMSQRAAINRLARRVPIQVHELIEFIGIRLE